MRTNQLRTQLAAGRPVIGSFVYVPSGKFTEIVGLAGYDFVVIDMEHGPVDTVVAEEMVRGAESGGAVPIIRVTHNAPHLILRALDVGAMGVHVPEVTTAAEARLAVSSSKYGPQGHRGLAGARAAGYGLVEPLAEYVVRANAETMVIAHIESETSVRNLEELLEVEGIDVYYLGPEDISNSLGIPGQSTDERVVQLVEQGIEQIVKSGKTAGCIASDVVTAKRYLELGARYIATHCIRHMTVGSRSFIGELRP